MFNTNAQCYQNTVYHKSCRRQLSYCGLHVRSVSVFGKKSDAVFGFLAYFCAVLRFSDPPYAPLNICWEHVRVSIVGNYNRTTKNNKLRTSCSLLCFILLPRSDRRERAATFKGNTQGETKSRIYHFLPGCIAFKQIALRFFLPECIAPRIKTWGSLVGESVYRSLPRLRVFFVANFLQQG